MNNLISRRDVALGTICAKPVRAGVDVPAGLRVNTLSLAELCRRARFAARPIDRDEAAALGFAAAEIDEWFGPAAAPAAAADDLVLRP